MTDVSILIKAQNQAGAAFQSVENDLRSMEKTIERVRQAGLGLTAGVTLPVVGVAAAAITSAADFEQSLNVMQQVSGATAGEMAALQDQALQLGAETAFSAGEAASAMLELAKAGLDAEQVGAAIAGTMDLAAAGNLGLAEAAEIAANSVNTFNLEASDSAAVANMLAAAANASSVDVGDLAQGMKMAGSVFASSGQSIEDLTTAMALMGNAGIKGSDAGTSLKTMLMRLTAPTGEAAELMSQLGVSMYNLDGSTRALPDVLADLQSAMYGTNAVQVTSSNLTAEQADRMEDLKKRIAGTQSKLMDYQSGIAGVAQSEEDKIVSVDRLNRELAAMQAEYSGLAAIGGTTTTVMREMTDETRAAALSTIFGADAIRAVNVLMASGEEGWAAMAEAVAADGAAAEVAGARMQGMAGAIEYIKGSVDSFLISTALPFLDTLSGIVRQVADAITWLGGLPEPLKNAALAFAGVMAAAGPVLLAISGIGTALTFLLSPLGLVVVGAAALAAAWAADFGGIQEKTAAVWAAIQPILDSAYNWLIEQIPTALTTLQGAWDTVWAALSTAVSNMWTAVQPLLQNAYNWLQTDGPTALTTLQNAWSTAWNAIATATAGVFAALWPQLLGAWAWLQVAAPAALTSLQNAWATAWSAIQAAVDAAWAAIQPMFQGALTWMQTDGPAALTTVQEAWSTAWSAIQEASSAAWAAIQENLNALLGWLQTDGPGALTTLQEQWNTTWNGLGETASAAWEQLQALFGPAIERLRGSFSGIGQSLAELGPKFDGLLASVQNMWNAVQPILSAFATFIGGVLVVAGLFGVNLLSEVFNSLGTVVGAVIDQITLTLNSLSTILSEATTLMQAVIAGDWNTVWESAKNIVMTFGGWVLGTFMNLWLAVSTIFTGIKNAVVNTLSGLGVDAQPILDGIKAWWDAAWNGLGGAVQTVTDGIAAAKGALTSFQEWVATFTLPDALAGWSFQDLLNWKWPDFTAIPEVVGTLLGWKWPDFTAIPDIVGTLLGWQWPGLTMPEWLDGLLDFEWPGFPALPWWLGGDGGEGQNGGEGRNASGTNFWRGGLTWVGERGPELISLPRGTKVYPNDLSMQMAGGMAGGMAPAGMNRVTVNIQQMIVRDDQDVHALAYRLANLIEKG